MRIIIMGCVETPRFLESKLVGTLVAPHLYERERTRELFRPLAVSDVTWPSTGSPLSRRHQPESIGASWWGWTRGE